MAAPHIRKSYPKLTTTITGREILLRARELTTKEGEEVTHVTSCDRTVRAEILKLHGIFFL